ncbi:polysaccharide biosynthesis protein [Aliivibrio fischeri]|uniref:lipopolysaccharide biosynthesis protein n=1 Tax=Aliivibrio fischeri TaxID=668 RepID=UPI0009080162|nr:polysaccharide biosynthesis protein [Aliivibrio fischeri]MUK61351.1 polysaccharide biosynthesis protein [Aliivibrio fischeri]MUL19460.1 polysaccharide biosynthesis protein [Aliivibrio fischeri]MUL25016.1 polysaccharide biosynthesis protein [Aliivibrio fischeri]
MKETSLKKRYAIKLFSSIVTGIVGMIMVAIVPKAIGPVAYGQFVYLQQFFTKVINFLDASSSIAFFTKLSANLKRKELITFYSKYVLFVFFVLVVFFFIFNLLGINQYILPGVNSYFISLGLLFGFLTWLTQIFIKISDAYAMTVSVELIKLTHKVLSLVFLICLISYLSLNLTIYFYYHIFILSAFILLMSIFFIKKQVFSWSMLLFDIIEFKKVALEFISYCIPLFAYSTVSLVVGLFDIWLLQNTSGSIETGFYGLSYSLAAMCFIFTGAMTPIITREFSKSFENKDMVTMAALFKRYIPMLYSIAAYFSIFIAFESENVLAIFTDKQFSDAYWVLMVMAFYPIHQTYGQLSGSIFYATGHTKAYRNIGFFSMGIGVLLTILFVHFLELGALGLGLKMVLTQFIAVNVQLFFNVRFLNINIKYFLKHQLFVVVLFGFSAYGSARFIDISSPIFDFLVSGLIYSLFVVTILFIYPSLFSISRLELQGFIRKFLLRK